MSASHLVSAFGVGRLFIIAFNSFDESSVVGQTAVTASLEVLLSLSEIGSDLPPYLLTYSVLGRHDSEITKA